MKTIKKTIITIAFFTANLSFGQDQIKPTCTVLNIQVKGEQMISSSEAGNITRHLMNKLSIYTILYDQDINYALTEKSSDLGKKLTYDCYSIQCLDNVGKLLNSNKMLSGYVERIRGNIIISFRELDVSTSKITNSISREYKDIPTELKNMVFLTLQEMYGVEREKQMIDYLTQINSREGVPNNPDVKRLNHSGVRMGVVHILGDNGDILKRPAGQGGYDASATLFQFGYQFETQYLNQGRVQGLFEFIPTITGLEQGLFLPSLTVLHGLRDNKTGLEFAFGPTFGVSKVAKGYFDDEVWKLRTEWDQEGSNPNPIVTRLDSRGNVTLNAGFLFGVGFSFKSGDLNIPVNLFTVMQKKSFRVGISFGFNAKGNSN
ncbi:MAG: hypothetical protein ABF264_00845 [Flavobacteriales bacterium]